MVSMEQIEELCKRIVSLFDPQRILLFGSYADGTATAHSDVDLLVIFPFNERPFIKTLEILNRTNPDFPVDLLARCPEDTERRYAEGDPLIREAVDKGRIMYERNDSRVDSQG